MNEEELKKLADDLFEAARLQCGVMFGEDVTGDDDVFAAEATPKEKIQKVAAYMRGTV